MYSVFLITMIEQEEEKDNEIWRHEIGKGGRENGTHGFEMYFITLGSLFTLPRLLGSRHHELTIGPIPDFCPGRKLAPGSSSRADSQNDLLFKRAYTRLYRHVTLEEHGHRGNLMASREWNALRESSEYERVERKGVAPRRCSWGLLGILSSFLDCPGWPKGDLRGNWTLRRHENFKNFFKNIHPFRVYVIFPLLTILGLFL